MSADLWSKLCAECRADHRVLQAKGALSIPVGMGVGCTPTAELSPASGAPATSRELLPCGSSGPALQGGERRAGCSSTARTERVERILDGNLGLSLSVKGGLSL